MNQHTGSEHPETRLPTPPKAPRKWVTLLLSTVIFLAGGVAGSGVTILLKLERWPGAPKTLNDRRDQLTERIAQNVRLDARQTKALRDIVGKRLLQIESIRKRILPEMKIEAEALDREIQPLLKEKQKPRWAKLYASLYERWFHQPPPAPEPSPAGKADSQPAPAGKPTR